MKTGKALLRGMKEYLMNMKSAPSFFGFIGGIFSLISRFIDYCLEEYFKSRLLHCGKGVGILKGTTFLCPDMISIGDYTCIGHYVHLRGGGRVVIGAHCQIANNVIIG